MKVLSLFDGISCGQIALNRVGIKHDSYYASEIDQASISVTNANFPNTIQLGDITQLSCLPKADLVMGGSPCQSFSKSGKQEGFLGKSKLFLEFLRILKLVKPKYWLLENVVMKLEFEQQISEMLGTSPQLIDSANFSAQNRKRLYWTNIPIGQYEDRGILIKDIIEPLDYYEFVHDGFAQSAKKSKNYIQYDVSGKGYRSQNSRAYYLDGKMCTLSHSAPHSAKILVGDRIRKTTRFEHERLQTIPDGYTSSLELNKAKAAIGNGWTVDVISHIFEGLKD